MTYAQKRGLVELLISTFVLLYYVNALSGMLSAEALTASALTALFAKVVVIMVLLEIVSHSVLAGVSARDANAGDDERDRLFKLKSQSIAYHVLSSFMVIAVFLIYVVDTGRDISRNPLFLSGVEPLFSIFHWLVVGLLITEIVKFALCLWYYRRGF